MTFSEWWLQYGWAVLDVLTYLAVAGALIWLCKLVSEARQVRRDRKDAELIYRQKADDECINQTEVGK